MPKPETARLGDTNSEFNGQKGYDIVLELGRVPDDHNATVAQTGLNYLLCKPGGIFSDHGYQNARVDCR